MQSHPSRTNRFGSHADYDQSWLPDPVRTVSHLWSHICGPPQPDVSFQRRSCCISMWSIYSMLFLGLQGLYLWSSWWIKPGLLTQWWSWDLRGVEGLSLTSDNLRITLCYKSICILFSMHPYWSFSVSICCDNAFQRSRRLAPRPLQYRWPHPSCCPIIGMNIWYLWSM